MSFLPKNLTNPIGVVGLGLMGQSLIKRLDDASMSVLGFDINPEQVKKLGEHRFARIPKIATSCEIIFLAVFNTTQVRETLFATDGLFAHAKQPLIVICTSTCDPGEIAQIALETENAGHHFFELPISGTSMQLARGDCLGLMGGDLELSQKLHDVLEVITPHRQYIGLAGDASKAKLAINLVLGLHRAALAEGLNFGVKLGLDPEKLLQTLQQSAAASNVMPIKGPLMVARSYDKPQSKVAQSLKDFSLIADLAMRADLNLPLAQVYIQLLETQLNDGQGDADNAIIYEAIHQNRLKNLV
jgi:3-hydroxyisobutyrate dehydrogenase-like beta-hydroxyacid dehydrogenase